MVPRGDHLALDQRLHVGHLVGRALDNRVGGYIIAQVMKRIAAGKKKPAFTLVGLNAVQEEIGGNGAMMATYRLKPDVCVCLDVTHATDTPGIDPAKFGSVKLGGGPTVVREFLDADLIDTLHIVVAPVELGAGVRLWNSPEELTDRFHLDVVPSPSGVTHHLFWRK